MMQTGPPIVLVYVLLFCLSKVKNSDNLRYSFFRWETCIVADASSLQLFCSLLLLIVITLKYSCKKKKNMYRKYSCKVCLVQLYSHCTVVESGCCSRKWWCLTTVQSLCVKLKLLPEALCVKLKV